MTLKYFDNFVGTAIGEINKFGDNQLSYGKLDIPNMSKAYKIIEQSSIGKSDANYVCVSFDSSSKNVTYCLVCPTTPEANKEKIINGSEFSANPLIEFLNQAFN